MATTKERRNHARQVVTRPCTVFRRQTQRYVAGRTRDLSAGGALIEVESPRPISAGEWIEVGVAWSPSPVLQADSLIEAKVVRVTQKGPNRQVLAVRFDHVDAALAAVA